MKKLEPVDTLIAGDVIKFMDSMKGVPVVELLGMKIGSINRYIDDNSFDGFYRPLPLEGNREGNKTSN